ncbi:eukaryotic translation initiation factor 3 subunit 5, putative [Eimeria necatrix]|uniref:Eukaryotic translation initiation factor 3 subunit 5, putative n=1 Tax=Eimeria necatrix TaxID=51315 RepID=U6MJL0_9EIME|nr:eukaryotic translation initiation factor 3 subunit 5, putative [Eimeria necatrix]CDJ63263.1 eukaryotic translation initiation factor 3 subunit 5, putative [Eimeria necatrix]
MSRRVSLLGANNQKPACVPKNFDLLPFPSLRVRLHPVPLMTILDAYIRRDEGQENVIGTLLGSCSDGNVIDVTDCFVDRHSLTGEGLLQIIKDHHESMFELKQQANGGNGGVREVVVGWFCTGSEMTELTCAVHGWFKQFSSVSKFFPQPPLTEPIHLMVDAVMESGSFSVKVYTQVQMTMAREACFQFHELPLELYATPSDRVGLQLLQKVRTAHRSHPPRAEDLTEPASEGVLLSDITDGLNAELEQLQEKLEICAAYVRRVLNGEVEPDPEVGRFLSSALSAATEPDLEAFEQLCQNTLQDSLMAAHLARLAKLQFAVAQKLNTSFF